VFSTGNCITCVFSKLCELAQIGRQAVGITVPQAGFQKVTSWFTCSIAEPRDGSNRRGIVQHWDDLSRKARSHPGLAGTASWWMTPYNFYCPGEGNVVETRW
jgi:hypothetical protein